MSIVRTRLYLETEQVRVVRRRGKSIRAFCDKCGKDVRMLTPDDAADLVSESAEKIYSLMYAAAIHSCLRDGYPPFVCLSSLSNF